MQSISISTIIHPISCATIGISLGWGCLQPFLPLSFCPEILLFVSLNHVQAGNPRQYSSMSRVILGELFFSHNMYNYMDIEFRDLVTRLKAPSPVFGPPPEEWVLQWIYANQYMWGWGLCAWRTQNEDVLRARCPNSLAVEANLSPNWQALQGVNENFCFCSAQEFGELVINEGKVHTREETGTIVCVMWLHSTYTHLPYNNLTHIGYACVYILVTGTVVELVIAVGGWRGRKSRKWY